MGIETGLGVVTGGCYQGRKLVDNMGSGESGYGIVDGLDIVGTGTIDHRFRIGWSGDRV